MTSHDERPGHEHGAGLAALALGALGVVYGDIGTSPLYAMKEAFTGAHGLPPTPKTSTASSRWSSGR